MSSRRPTTPAVGAQQSDHAGWRLAFQVLGGRAAPFWITLWLILIISGLVALGVVAGPWVPGAVTAVGGLIAGGRAIVKTRRGKAATLPPDPALDPPPP